MKASSAKAKGRSFQQLIAKRIAKLLNIPYGKDELIASREMGQSGTDVKLIGEARTRFPFSIECKNCERWSIPEWIKQAKENQLEGTDWLLIVKRNREHPICIMDVDTLFKMMGESDS